MQIWSFSGLIFHPKCKYKSVKLHRFNYWCKIEWNKKFAYDSASRRLQRLVFFVEQRLDVDRRTNWIRKFVHFYYNFKTAQRPVRLQQSEDVRFDYFDC
ncbi:hypothetical protein T01_12209 [Trichinella spiralis]|uniref:Uncharacterized protein n=1 Tax=Trichinella spiralis TaxID=6334 RepID=A0A0V1AYZ9_TRISP|nr:hypothetical protein T01_12209 [Trichinella spiralis]